MIQLIKFLTGDDDGDGIPDHLDPDDDNDGIPDFKDDDDDNDGIRDEDEGRLYTHLHSEVFTVFMLPPIICNPQHLA